MKGTLSANSHFGDWCIYNDAIFCQEREGCKGCELPTRCIRECAAEAKSLLKSSKPAEVGSDAERKNDSEHTNKSDSSPHN